MKAGPSSCPEVKAETNLAPHRDSVNRKSRIKWLALLGHGVCMPLAGLRSSWSLPGGKNGGITKRSLLCNIKYSVI